MFMEIRNNSISFQSKIKFIDAKTFKNKTRHLNPKKHEVGWPWTADTMKQGKNLFTTGLMDCIAVVIKDGNRTKLGHIATFNQKQARDTHQRGFRIANVKHRLLENVNLQSENLHGYIIGGFELNPNDKNNAKHLKKVKNIFDENFIPYTIFAARKDVHYFGKFSLFFSNKEDTLYITNSLTKPNIRNKNNAEIEINGDTVEYNTYKKIRDKNGTTYKCTRQRTGVKEFLESQFREVSLCSFDELI